MGKKERERAAQREIAAREAAETHWQIARSLAHDLMEGELADTGQVWGVVLEPGERFLSDVRCDYSRYFGSNAAYTHVSGLYIGSAPFVALGMGLTAVGNAARRSAAEAAARTQWRDYQQVRVIVTDRRSMCQLVDGRWLSFYYRCASAVYPEPGIWSLVMDFPDTSPVRLGGFGSPIACVAAIWAIYGAEGLRDHPGLQPLRN
ncbi:MAG TPA: hypothetical protein VK817_17355 [Trebonia sp.]|jgi:hypothetical protein|nr:hypothetical protein [Trebonia sp.]